MKILIVGAGISGLTLAAFLENSPIEYEIAEKSKTPGQGGFMLVTWDNGRDILRKLGLADKFDAHGTRIRNYSIRNGKGRVLRNYSLRDFYIDYGTAITMLSRERLCEWLLGKIDGSKIMAGIYIAEIEQGAEKVRVKLSSGETREYDAVMGADGVHSAVRALQFRENIEKYENWRCWWFWVPSKFNSPATITEYVEPRENILLFSAGERTLAVLTAPAEHTMRDGTGGRVNRLKEIFKDEPAVMPGALEGIADKDVMTSDLLNVEVKNWVKGRVALMGDAAHAFSIHAGLGAGMAMEDAYVLAGELMRASAQCPLERALLNYERKRKHRVRIAKILNEKMRLWTLIRSRPWRKIVNLGVKFVPERFFVEDYNKLLKEEI